MTEIEEPAEPLRYRSFVYYCGTRMATMMAWQMVGVAVGWQMYELTRSALALGFVGLAQFLPLLILALVAGHVADRFDRRYISFVCDLIEACAVCVLTIATIIHVISPPLIYGMIVLLGLGRAFGTPAMFALLPNVVPQKIIAAASARVSTAMQVAMISAPAIGGLLYAVNPAIPYAIATVMFVLAALCVTLIRTRAATVSTQGPATLQSIFAGLAFIKESPLVLGAISLDLFAVLLGGATALLPIFARDILVIGPWGLGVLRSAPAIGAIAYSLVLGRSPVRRHAGRVMFGAVAIYGCATIVFGVSHWFWISFAALAVLGACDVVSVVIRSTIVAILTPDEMRGRVNAVNALFIGTSNQVGEFESGVTAALLGPLGAVVLGGCGAILVAAAGTRAFSDLFNVDSLDDIKGPVSPVTSEPAPAPSLVG